MPQTQLRFKLWPLSAKKTESQVARSSVKLSTATNCSFMHDTYNYSMLKSWIIGTIGCSSLNPSESLSCATSVGICMLKKCLCMVQSICVTHSPYSLAPVINYNSSWTYCYHVYTLASWQYFLFLKKIESISANVVNLSMSVCMSKPYGCSQGLSLLLPPACVRLPTALETSFSISNRVCVSILR